MLHVDESPRFLGIVLIVMFAPLLNSCNVILNVAQKKEAAETPELPSLKPLSIELSQTEDRLVTLGPRTSNGTVLEYSIIQQPLHGQVTIEGVSASSIFALFENNDSVRAYYTPSLPYVAQDSFTYQVSNHLKSSLPISVHFDIARDRSLFEQIGDSLELPLPSGLRLSIDLPLTDSSDINITNQAGIDYHPIPVDSPLLQSNIKRPGKSFAAYTPGNSEGITEGRWRFGPPSACNSLANGSFALQAWVYLARNNFTDFFVPINDWVLGGSNIFYGGGGPDSFAPRIGVYEDPSGQHRLTIHSVDVDDGGAPTDNRYLRSDEVFQFDRWVHVAATYDQNSNTTILYSDGFEVARDQTITYHHTGPWHEYNLGSAEFNHWWGFAWRGYISNFKLYTLDAPSPCDNSMPDI